MNYIVIKKLPNGKCILQIMNEQQYNALKNAGLLDGATIYSTNLSVSDLAEKGLVGAIDCPALAQMIIDDAEDIHHVSGPSIRDLCPEDPSQ